VDGFKQVICIVLSNVLALLINVVEVGYRLCVSGKTANIVSDNKSNSGASHRHVHCPICRQCELTAFMLVVVRRLI